MSSSVTPSGYLFYKAQARVARYNPAKVASTLKCFSYFIEKPAAMRLPVVKD